MAMQHTNGKNKNLLGIRGLLTVHGIAIVLIFSAACTKKGTALQESLGTNIGFQALTEDTMRLGIKIDDELVANDFWAPTVSPREIPLRYYNKEKKISIYDMGENRILFDSLFTINTNKINISLYQSASGGKLVYIAPSDTLSAPPEGYGKISLVYTFAGLPETVKVVVENSLTGGVEYGPTDSFTLKKGAFSRYYSGRTNSLRRPQLSIYTNDAQRKKVGMVDRGEFSNMNADFTIYSIRRSMSNVNGVYNLLQQKLY